MADLKVIANYVPTEWNNYIPPSIDQNRLNHLETNMKLNRDTINDLIRRLGLKPSGTTSEDSAIYNNPIYATLVEHKNKIKQLEADKLDKVTYNTAIGDMSKLKGGTTLVEAINNRLRRDIDDNADKTYTFKKLILTSTEASVLAVSGGVNIAKNLTVAGISSSGKINVTHKDGLETTKLKVTDTATFDKTITVTEKITGNKGLEIKNGANITGTLTVDNLVVTGKITCSGDAEFSNNVKSKTITTTSTITADADIKTKGAFRSTAEYIEFNWEKTPLHKLYVHGGSQGLGSGDAFIQTVS